MLVHCAGTKVGQGKERAPEVGEQKGTDQCPRGALGPPFTALRDTTEVRALYLEDFVGTALYLRSGQVLEITRRRSVTFGRQCSTSRLSCQPPSGRQHLSITSRANVSRVLTTYYLVHFFCMFPYIQLYTQWIPLIRTFSYGLVACISTIRRRQ